MKRGIKAVFFDLGGTLFDHLEATTSDNNLRQAFLTLPEAIQDRLNASEFTASYRRLRVQTEAQFVEKQFYLHRELVTQAFVHAVTELAPEVSDQVPLHKCALNFCDLQRQSVIEQLRLRADTEPTLAELHARDLRCAIVSNIDDDYLKPLLAKHKLHSHFEYCLSSEAAGCCKPHTNIFHRALEQLGLPAEQVLFVGDSLPHDIVGANAVGMTSCWLRTSEAASAMNEQPDHGPDHIIDRLSDVIQCLD